MFTIGRKGGKEEKGESAKVSEASVVPQTKWKQCVWKSGSGTDSGKIKVYINGIRSWITHSRRKFIPFQIKYSQEERPHSK